ncbi:MAG: mannose-1-phosphate guanylyltransferase [Bacteroidaceae bacterium]|nr:mannose-1-phosphate guanylyltransferase [Bacteroidaceae bacterium]MBR1593824.1 mannose-1-phosphate guanylyltransferase [Alloprevotella sp.]
MSTKNKHDYCVILAGGIGKRLWPCSRRSRPKQFIDFFGTGQTLLQQTYARIARILPCANIYISTYADYLPMVTEQLPEVPRKNILAEPVQLSTAPATAWASYHIALHDPEASIFISPCDQLILNEEAFARELREALAFVREHDVFLAMGITATRPNSAYGYVQMGDEVQQGLFTVRSFTEKPNEEYAQKFVDSGEFLWNTGIFLWNSRTIREMLRRMMPLIDEMMPLPDGTSATLEKEIETVRRFYPVSARRSIDLLILDKCENVFVKHCSFGWADIGCWPELHAAKRKDGDGNAVVGKNKTMIQGCRNTLVCLPDRMAAVVRGLDGYLVAANDNVLVVCPNDDPALVKMLFNEAQVKLGAEYV